MTKYERRQFFERLVQLRALYKLRGTDDSESGMPVYVAIAYAECLMSETAELVAEQALDTAGQVASTASDTGRN